MAKPNFEPAAAETVIGNGLHVKGNLEAASDIWIDGVIEGNVTTTGNLVIGANGRVNGHVSAANVSLTGEVIGNLNASDRVMFNSKGKLKGDLKTSNLSIADGATVNGQVTMPAASDQQSSAQS